MTTANSTTSSESPVLASVRQWLNEQGAPLEMRCAHVFTGASAQVVQSQYYVSPQGKLREIDVVAHFTSSWMVQPRPIDAKPDTHNEPKFDKMTLDICCVVECKSGPLSQKPWIVFSSSRTLFPRNARFRRLGTSCAKRTLLEASLDQETWELDLFQLGERPGYSLACAFKSETKNNESYDPAFNALSSVTAAALSKTTVEDRDGKWPEYVSRVVLPVIVVDTPIVECWLDDHGAMQLRECDRATVLWRNPSIEETVISIDIVHERALPKYVNDVQRALSVLEGCKGLLEDMATGLFS